jgi:hypothetical protein
VSGRAPPNGGYSLGRSHSLRAGAAYGGNTHVTAGMAFRF